MAQFRLFGGEHLGQDGLQLPGAKQDHSVSAKQVLSRLKVRQ